MPVHLRPLLFSYMYSFDLFACSCNCESCANAKSRFDPVPFGLADSKLALAQPALPHSHAAPERRSQASHPPRVLSTRHHSHLRCTRATPRGEGRRAHDPPLARQVGWQPELARAPAGHRQSTPTQQSAGASIHRHSYSCRQSRASRHPLPRPAASGARRHWRRREPADGAALRPNGAGSKEEQRDQENSR